MPNRGILGGGGVRRVLKYLKATKYYKRIIGSNDLLNIETWIDASHAVHEDIRGDTGGYISCGFGVIQIKFSNQKFNTKRTMESEVVAVSDYMPYKIYRIGIFLVQVYALHKKTFIKTMKAQLRCKITAEIHAQVIQGTFPSDFFCSGSCG